MSCTGIIKLLTILAPVLRLQVFFIALQAMFHFRLPPGEKMHLKRLILCSLLVRNIFAFHRITIAPKSPTCRGVALAKTEVHRINSLQIRGFFSDPKRRSRLAKRASSYEFGLAPSFLRRDR